VRLVWQSGEVACGGVLLDGMALGIPAVAVASDAARQLIVDGETGRIVAADPESDFPRRALGIVEDDALASRYGEAARARAVAEFPADRMVAAVVAACDRQEPLSSVVTPKLFQRSDTRAISGHPRPTRPPSFPADRSPGR
jgi:hypothetical protein